MKKIAIHIGALLFGVLFGTLLFNVFDFICNNTPPDAPPTMTAITALKERCRATFYDNMNEEVADDFVSFIEYNDEEILAVYYRLYNNGNDNKFVIVPNKEAEEPWMAFLHQIKNETATQENLWQFTFYLSLDENVLRVSGGDIREA